MFNLKSSLAFSEWSKGNCDLDNRFRALRSFAGEEKTLDNKITER
jgi:hypothetical protein